MLSFRVIVEESIPDQWVAWFASFPLLSAIGGNPSNAIERLLEFFDRDALSTCGIESIHEAARIGHFEFDIALRDRYADILLSAQLRMGITKPSLN